MAGFDELRFLAGQLAGSVNALFARQEMTSDGAVNVETQLVSMIRQLEDVEAAKPEHAQEARELIDRLQRLLKPVREKMLSNLP